MNGAQRARLHRLRKRADGAGKKLTPAERRELELLEREVVKPAALPAEDLTDAPTAPAAPQKVDLEQLDLESTWSPAGAPGAAPAGQAPPDAPGTPEGAASAPEGAAAQGPALGAEKPQEKPPASPEDQAKRAEIIGRVAKALSGMVAGSMVLALELHGQGKLPTVAGLAIAPLASEDARATVLAIYEIAAASFLERHLPDVVGISDTGVFVAVTGAAVGVRLFARREAAAAAAAQ